MVFMHSRQSTKGATFLYASNKHRDTGHNRQSKDCCVCRSYGIHHGSIPWRLRPLAPVLRPSHSINVYTIPVPACCDGGVGIHMYRQHGAFDMRMSLRP